MLSLTCVEGVKMEETKMLRTIKTTKLMAAIPIAAILAGALVISTPMRAMADPHGDADRYAVHQDRDYGHHAGWDRDDRRVDRDDVRYTVVCDRDGDNCRTVPNYQVSHFRFFSPGTWFAR
jgi:hypothetical protein